MNLKNLDYLKDALKYLGFGDKMNADLEANIEKRLPEFTLKHATEMENKKLESTLHFRRSDQNEMYFLNRYEASLTNSKDPSLDRTQTFYIAKNAGITAKEALNLLEGRAVCKKLYNSEGVNYTAWQQLDFTQKDERGNFKVKQFHENYGFNLDRALVGLPVKELNQPEQCKILMYSLQKGNLHSVTMDFKGKDEKMFIEANPQFKTVNVYDGTFQKVDKQTLVQRNSDKESLATEVKNEVKRGPREQQKSNTIDKDGGDDLETNARTKRTKKKGLSP